MSLITGDITPDGAVIAIRIGVSANRKKRLNSVNLPVPPEISLRAVIDTGSFVIGLIPSVFQSLEIKHFRTIPVRTPSTTPGEPHQAKQYNISLSLVSANVTKYLPSVHAIASDDFDKDEGIQALIGRDVLDHCNFSYYGPDRSFALGF
jgi:hypothetical protein